MAPDFDPADAIYRQLAALLRTQIYNGQIRGKIPGLRELAQEYSINIKTANKAIGLLVAEGLLFRVRGKGTFVRKVAESATDTLCGLVVPNVTNPYFARTAQAIEEQGFGRGIAFLVNATGATPEKLFHIVAMYRSRGIQLAVVHGGSLRDPGSLERAMESGLHLIGIHTHSNEIDDVWPDVRAGAQLAADHLLENFGGPLAFVSGSDDPIRETGRFVGYRDALLSYGLEPEPRYLIETAPTYRGGFEAVEQLAQLGDLPRAVLFYNQVMAMGGINALRSRGIRIPDDVAVVGIDDGVDEEHMLVPTTAISFPFEIAARQVLTLIRRRLESPGAETRSIRLIPKIVIRESSTPG